MKVTQVENVVKGEWRCVGVKKREQPWMDTNGKRKQGRGTRKGDAELACCLQSKDFVEWVDDAIKKVVNHAMLRSRKSKISQQLSITHQCRSVKSLCRQD